MGCQLMFRGPGQGQQKAAIRALTLKSRDFSRVMTANRQAEEKPDQTKEREREKRLVIK